MPGDAILAPLSTTRSPDYEPGRNLRGQVLVPTAYALYFGPILYSGWYIQLILVQG